MRAEMAFVILSLLLSKCMVAQTPSWDESDAFKKQASMGKTGSNSGEWRKVVENRSASSIVALEAVYHCASSGYFKHVDYTHVHDSLEAYGTDNDVPPGASIEITAYDPELCPGKVEAVIFADGHSEGDPQFVNDLYMRRRGIYQILDVIRAHVDRIASQQETPQSVIEFLTKLDGSNGLNMKVDISERAGMSYAIGLVKMMLAAGPMTSWRVPSDSTLDRLPRASAVMLDLNVSREQAQAIIFSKKLAEWSSDLGKNLEPSPVAR